jgi:Fe-S cluster biogenesis protein NfuA/nitrite reductase/ring-hydroxylating ferredoxin subunit
MQDTAVREEIEALEKLLAQVEDLPEGAARDASLAAVQGLLRIYGEALRRVVADAPPALLEQLRSDELVSELLMLHELHPTTLEERIIAALEEVRPYIGSHGGGIELVEVRDGVARVRLEGTCSGCSASAVTLTLAVEEAILRRAPELRAVEAVEEPQQARDPLPAGGLLPMFEPLAATAPRGTWVTVDGLENLHHDRPLARPVAGQRLIFASLDGQLYAYADRCPACRSEFDDPLLSDGALRCARCQRCYDLRRAGVAVDGGLLQLDPVPLLAEDGQVRVALEAVAA